MSLSSSNEYSVTDMAFACVYTLDATAELSCKSALCMYVSDFCVRVLLRRSWSPDALLHGLSLIRLAVQAEDDASGRFVGVAVGPERRSGVGHAQLNGLDPVCSRVRIVRSQ
jgi:hypothetical protein